MTIERRYYTSSYIVSFSSLNDERDFNQRYYEYVKIHHRYKRNTVIKLFTRLVPGTRKATSTDVFHAYIAFKTTVENHAVEDDQAITDTTREVIITECRDIDMLIGREVGRATKAEHSSISYQPRSNKEAQRFWRPCAPQRNTHLLTHIPPQSSNQGTLAPAIPSHQRPIFYPPPTTFLSRRTAHGDIINSEVATEAGQTPGLTKQGN